MNLEGAVCVVTGATEGIGLAIARRLASAGARVAICARREPNVREVVRKLREGGGTVVGEACDVSRERSVERFAAFVREQLGPADVVVNNAGLAHAVSVEEMTPEQFDEIMAVNVRGVFLVTKAFLADLKARAGHIVNVASLAGRNAVPGLAAYAASKHAVLGFSKSLFMEVRRHGVRVTAVCPGTVVTPFFEKTHREVANPEAKLQPEDIAETVLAVLRLPGRALISELDIRPTNP